MSNICLHEANLSSNHIFPVSSQETHCVTFTQSAPSPGFTLSEPGIRNVCFQPALNKTLCFTTPSQSCQQFKHSKLQNKKISLPDSAIPPSPPIPIGFQQKVRNQNQKAYPNSPPPGNDPHPQAIQALQTTKITKWGVLSLPQ